MIRFACPGCQATYSVPDGKAGKTGKCPKCTAQFVIPTPDPRFAAPPPPPAFDPTPPPAASTDIEVEIAPCPGCRARLMIPETDVGVDVECPYCRTVYVSSLPGAVPEAEAPRSRHADDDRPSQRRRDEYEDEDEEPAPRRRGGRRKPPKRRDAGPDKFLVFMAVFGIVSAVFLMLSVIWWPFGAVLMVAAYGLSFAASIWFLVIAFQEGVGEGFLVLLLPFYSLYYLITRFQDVKRPFFLSMACLVVLLLEAAVLVLTRAR